jgi:putative acetyltransferase
MTITIRPECPADENTIGEVTRQAFLSHPHSSHTEQFIVQALRKANALSVSLVAEGAGRVIGHIAFSPVTITDGSCNWFGLGSVSVLPEFQGQAIGRALIERGLECLSAVGAQGCVLLGEPSLYGRFGFANCPGLVLEGVPQEFFLSLPLGSTSAHGKVTYHAAFSAEGYPSFHRTCAKSAQVGEFKR